MWQHDKRYCDVAWTTIVSNAMHSMKHKWCTIRQPHALTLSRLQRKFATVYSRIALMNEWEQLICSRVAALVVYKPEMNNEGSWKTNSSFLFAENDTFGSKYFGYSFILYEFLHFFFKIPKWMQRPDNFQKI